MPTGIKKHGFDVNLVFDVDRHRKKKRQRIRCQQVSRNRDSMLTDIECQEFDVNRVFDVNRHRMTRIQCQQAMKKQAFDVKRQSRSKGFDVDR